MVFKSDYIVNTLFMKISDIVFESSRILKSNKLKSVKIDNNINRIRFFDKDRYTIFDINDLLMFDSDLKKKLIKLLKNEIRHYLKYKNINCKSLLVVGLGNKDMMADCLGDKVINKIFATRQFNKRLIDDRFIDVSSYSLGVFGKTGIESASVVEKLKEIVKPDLIIVVDTFVTNKYERLNKSLQFSSCGISPGAGVDNARKYINYEFLKVPTFSIGVPLLINYRYFTFMDKEIEKYVKFYSDIIAGGINTAVHKDVSESEIEKLRY